MELAGHPSPHPSILERLIQRLLDHRPSSTGVAVHVSLGAPHITDCVVSVKRRANDSLFNLEVSICFISFCRCFYGIASDSGNSIDRFLGRIPISSFSRDTFGAKKHLSYFHLYISMYQICPHTPSGRRIFGAPRPQGDHRVCPYKHAPFFRSHGTEPFMSPMSEARNHLKDLKRGVQCVPVTWGVQGGRLYRVGWCHVMCLPIAQWPPVSNQRSGFCLFWGVVLGGFLKKCVPPPQITEQCPNNRNTPEAQRNQ